MEATEKEISEEALDKAEDELKTQREVIKILRKVAPEKRLRVLRASSILLLGKDLSEL